MPCVYASRLLKYKYQRLLPQDVLKGIARLHTMTHSFLCKGTRSGSEFGLLMGSERRIFLQKTAPIQLLRWRFAADPVQRFTLDIAKRRVRTREHCHTGEHQLWISCSFILQYNDERVKVPPFDGGRASIFSRKIVSIRRSADASQRTRIRFMRTD